MAILEAIGRGKALSPIQDLLEKKREADEVQRIRENDPRLKLASIKLAREQRIDVKRAVPLTMEEVRAGLSQYAPETQDFIMKQMASMFDKQGQTTVGQRSDWTIKNFGKDSPLTLSVARLEKKAYWIPYQDAKEKWDNLKAEDKDSTKGRLIKKDLDEALFDYTNISKTTAGVEELAEKYKQEKETAKQEVITKKAAEKQEQIDELARIKARGKQTEDIQSFVIGIKRQQELIKGVAKGIKEEVAANQKLQSDVKKRYDSILSQKRNLEARVNIVSAELSPQLGETILGIDAQLEKLEEVYVSLGGDINVLGGPSKVKPSIDISRPGDKEKDFKHLWD